MKLKRDGLSPEETAEQALEEMKQFKDAMLDIEDPMPKASDNVGTMVYSYQNLRGLVMELHEKLTTVLKRHELDFLNAYKAHMEKVTAELKFLKQKADEQNRHMNKDNDQIIWYKQEKSNMQKEQGKCLYKLEVVEKKSQKFQYDYEILEKKAKAMK